MNKYICIHQHDLILPPDLTHLIKSEVPVKPTLYTQSTEENFESPKARKPRAISDPCQPNPCHNGGLCVSSQGKATCRFVNFLSLVMAPQFARKNNIIVHVPQMMTDIDSLAIVY